MKEDVRRVKDVVERVLENDPKTRNNDKWLILEVLREMGYKVFIPYDTMDEMPAFESITRCRRKIQEKGLFTALEKIQEARKMSAEEMQKISGWF